jgi:hypothetical protein
MRVTWRLSLLAFVLLALLVYAWATAPDGINWLSLAGLIIWVCVVVIVSLVAILLCRVLFPVISRMWKK